MLRAIFYKEWLKTRWYYLVAVLLSLGFVGYVLLNFFRAAGLKGIAHLWEVMLLRDAVFVDLLQFVPLVVGLLFAVVQFVPEMQRKCLKLTLHLPCPELRMIGAMLLYGGLLLGVLFAVSLGVLFVAFRAVLAPELVRHIADVTLSYPGVLHRGMRRGSPPICSRRGSVWNRRGGAGCSTVRSRRAC